MWMTRCYWCFHHIVLSQGIHKLSVCHPQVSTLVHFTVGGGKSTCFWWPQRNLFKVMVKPYIVLADWCNYYTFELCLGAGVIVHAWLMHPWTSARKLPCLDESVCSVTALWISCQVGAQEACALSVCFLLWNITSLVTGKPEFFPLWGVLTKMTWQFVFQGWNQNTVINLAWANTTATLFSSSTLPDKGGGFLHTPRAWYFRAETSLCRPWGLSSSPLTGRSTF